MNQLMFIAIGSGVFFLLLIYLLYIYEKKKKLTGFLKKSTVFLYALFSTTGFSLSVLMLAVLLIGYK